MKVVAINGSPRKDGNTASLLEIMAKELKLQGITVETLHVGGGTLRGCTACGYCKRSERNLCVFGDDMVNSSAAKMREADGIVLAAPAYYAGIPGTMKSFLDRVFFSSARYFKYKVGTAVTTARRTGGLDVLHQLQNYFSLAQTVTPPSQYWTVAYGLEKKEVFQDSEGIQTIRRNARSMAWLLEVIAAGRERVPLPTEEDRLMTNFIR